MNLRISTFLLAASLPLLAAAAPKVGDVFPLTERQFKGWTLLGHSVGDTPHALFEKDGTYLIAFSRPASVGGKQLQRITKVEIARPRNGETIIRDAVCSPDGATAPDIAFYDAHAGVVRGLFIRSGTLITKTWRQRLEDCAYGED